MDFFYNLATTRKGQIPVKEIRKGTMVLCKGEWKAAPKPELGRVKVHHFEVLPTTAFAEEWCNPLNEVLPNNKPILNKLESPDFGLTVMGYFNENRKSEGISFSNFSKEELSYWWPRITKCCGVVPNPLFMTYGKINFSGISFPASRTFSGNELSERNLEYYLEGMFRRNFHENRGTYSISARLCENGKLALRLLNIQCKKVDKANLALCNPVSAMSHIKDDFNKSKLEPYMIKNALRNQWIEPGQYAAAPRSEFRACRVEDAEDWILPGICPDINALSPTQYS